MHHLVGQGGDPAAGVERGGYPMGLLPGVVRGDQMLGAVLCPFDRPAQRPRQPRHQEVLRVELAAHPEPAARVDGVHVDQGLVHPEHGGEQVPVEHRDLGHAEDRQPAGPRVRLGQQHAGLQRHAGVPPDLDLGLHHVRRLAERGFGVPVAEGEIGGDVPGREQARRAGAGRGGGVEHRRFLIDVDLHQLGGVLGGIGVAGDHDGDRFPHVAHHAGGQHRLQVAGQVDVPDGQPHGDGQPGGHVAGGDGRDDPVRPAGLGEVDLPQPPVGDGGAHHPRPHLARRAEVVAEPAAAAQQPRVFLARHPGADHGHGPPARRRDLAVASTASTMPW